MAHEYVQPTVSMERQFRMSYEDYRNWTDEDTFSEWVDGEVTVFMPPEQRHQLLSLFLGAVVGLFADLRGLGRILPAPFEMKLRNGRSYREPDLLFVSTPNLARLGDHRLDGPADLVIEIVSPESAARDQREKFAEYAGARIPEYWLVDPREGRQTFRPYRLGEDGIYEDAPLDERGRYYSPALPGFWLDPEWLDRDPLPTYLQAIFTIAPGLVDNHLAAIRGNDLRPGNGTS
jgi:Uma2 family endonuclease